MRKTRVAVISSHTTGFSEWVRVNSEEGKYYFQVKSEEDLVGRKIDELIITKCSINVKNREHLITLCRKIIGKKNDNSSGF